MSMSPLSINLKEWEYCTPESAGSQLSNVFIEQNAETSHLIQALGTYYLYSFFFTTASRG